MSSGLRGVALGTVSTALAFVVGVDIIGGSAVVCAVGSLAGAVVALLIFGKGRDDG